MALSCPFIAFGIGNTELLVILVVGLLIFGRRLPEVGRAVGRTVTQFRRGLDEFKQQMDRDEDMREVKSTMHDLKRAANAPRQLSDPKRLFEKLTDESMATPGPDTTVVEPAAAKSALEVEREKLDS